MRRLEILQWVGLLAGAAVWGAAHVVGFGIAEADCSRGSSGWGIQLDVWQGVLMGISGGLALVAGLASVGVVIGTGGSSYEADPPIGRVRFFAIAALVANALFLVIIALDGVGTIANVACRQA